MKSWPCLHFPHRMKKVEEVWHKGNSWILAEFGNVSYSKFLKDKRKMKWL